MNRALDWKRNLEQLEALRGGLEAYLRAVRGADQESARDLARLERQYRQARQQLEEGRAARVAEAQADYEAAMAAFQSRVERRAAAIARAHAAIRRQRLQTSEAHEARRVFQAQRELLQTTRNRDAALQSADAQFAAFAEQLAQVETEWTAQTQRSQTAFRGYPGLRRQLRLASAAALAPEREPDANGQLRHAQSQIQMAREALDRFQRLLWPGVFRVAPCWLIIGIEVAVCAAAVPLVRMLGYSALTWSQAGVACALLLAMTLSLYRWSRRRAAPAAETIASSLQTARGAHAAAAAAARLVHQQAHDRALAEAQAQCAALEQAWNAALEAGIQERADLDRAVQLKRDRAMARLDRLRAQTLARIEREFEARVDAARRAVEAQLQSLEREQDTRRQALADRREARQQELVAELRRTLDPAGKALAQARQIAQVLAPPWTAPIWREWTSPTTALTAVPFGLIELALGEVPDGLPTELQRELSGLNPLAAPLALTLPAHGSVWLETRESGRAIALATLNNLVIRLLAASPPGRIAFTIVDPVGLGQNFAGLMHLVDHADRLINRRIWTQPEQIDQQLADLNEQIEKVTQLYLRNEYPTIAEYNEQAGRVAEPYHFLVIADFPSGFTETGLRRLQSIVASGPRCGVFTLIHWDRQKPLPAGFEGEDLWQTGVWLEARGAEFGLGHIACPGTSVRLDPAPDAALATGLLQRIGRSSMDAYRVELPFAQIAPDSAAMWSVDTTTEIRVPIGITGATKLQHLALGKGTCQHALVAGKTGSGKSTLFHVLIINLALWAGPDRVEFYLIDFKKGVEFKCYATHRLPHARVVAIESDREFALSVLERLDQELRRRGDLFRQCGVQDLPGYHRAGGMPRLPRTLLIIDEFQEFFTEDDRVAQHAALLLDRLVRQGRAFGMHVLLGSQTLGGAYTLARATLGQMTVRIALQCNPTDALLILDEENTAPRLLSRPGEAIYNEAAGALEGNRPFQVAWLPDDERDSLLCRIRHRADREAPDVPPPVVFEGNAPANIRDNPRLEALLNAPRIEPQTPPRLWFGAPNSIKGPTEIALRRQSGNHLLIVGLYDETILALLGYALVALAAQHARDAAQFVVFDASAPGSPADVFWQQMAGLIPHAFRRVGPAECLQALDELTRELDRRGSPLTLGPSLYVVLHQIPRFKALRFEDEFALSLDAGGPGPGQQLSRILSEGPPAGLHVLCNCDTYGNAVRSFGRKALAEFELRILFQMSAADSASLIDSPQAAALGLHRALLHNVQDGLLETFRPYAPPDADWLEQAGRQLARLSSGARD